MTDPIWTKIKKHFYLKINHKYLVSTQSIKVG